MNAVVPNPEKTLHASVPPALLAQAEEMAQQEHISLDELVSEAMERCRQKLRVYGGSAGPESWHYQRRGVERVVHEYRDAVRRTA